VVDEVLAVGDAEFQKKAIGKMQDISQGEGRTVLFVSHNMAAVRSLCTKGLVLENGGITFQGSSNHAVKKYLNLTSNEGKEINLSLKSRNDRIGGDKFRYVKVKILNKEGVELNQCISGDYLKIKIFYELKENFDPARFIFGFSF
jgi:lipopolysaccharide transport system ATP-binding protein